MIDTAGLTRPRRRQRRTTLQRRATKRLLLGIRTKRRYIPWLIAALTILFAGVALLGALGVAAAMAFDRLTADLPSPEGAIEREVFKTATLYDRNGEVLYELWDPQAGRRTVKHLDELPAAVISATLATEDANFYSNPGFDPASIARALWQNLRGGDIVSGASTITQQLVRNILMDPAERFEQSYVRKFREAALAYRFSQAFSKDQILEMYLNEVPYGNLSFGIEAAAQSYFDKPADDLTLAEAALIAGLPQSPSAYNPLVNLRAAKERQNEVLGLMVKHGFIGDEEAAEARREELHFRERRYDIKAPHFAFYVRQMLEERYGERQLFYGGLKIYTTLDLRLQEIAERVAKQHVATIAKYNASNAALVAINPRTGEVLAMVGSVDFYDTAIDGQVNIAISDRQPGSTLKPFTYLLAFQRGLAPASVVVDREVEFPDGEGRPPYKPRNHDGQFRGPVTLRHALANSLNIPAVLMLQSVGVSNLLDALHQAGITSLNDPQRYGLALTLGGGEVRLLDLAFAYATLANGGSQVGRPIPAEGTRAGYRKYEPVVVTRIEDADGNVLEDYRPPAPEPLFSPQLTYMITDILSDDAARTATYGLHSTLELPRPAAAKTGTTDDYRDAWTIGYTPDLVAGVWVGNSDSSPMDNVFGSAGAGVIWHDFMVEATRDQPPTPFIRPDGLMRATVSKLTGLRPGPGEPTVSDWFLESAVPEQWAQPIPTPTATATATPTPAPSVTATPTRAPSAVSQATPTIAGRPVVPNVIGLSEAEARRRIEAAGFINSYPNYQGPGDVPAEILNTVAPGAVLSQNPGPGSAQPPGTTVYLAIRKR